MLSRTKRGEEKESEEEEEDWRLTFVHMAIGQSLLAVVHMAILACWPLAMFHKVNFCTTCGCYTWHIVIVHIVHITIGHCTHGTSIVCAIAIVIVHMATVQSQS